MSFHRKAFLVWLALMMSVGASAMVVDYCGDACGAPEPPHTGSAMDQLIEAATGRAKDLRDSAYAASDHSTRSAEKEAERWEWLAANARTELLNLRSKQAAP
jgi:sRNA-binding protein